jgi:mono/diheme cytochrome c family protein
MPLDSNPPGPAGIREETTPSWEDPMARRPYVLLLPALLLVPLFGRVMGGWATVTVEEVPDYVEAGKPLPFTFMVRQHGVTPLKGIHPTIEARSGGNTARAAAEPSKEAGQYVAALALREPGDWTITINSGFGNSKLTLLPIRAIAAGSRAPAALAADERGRRLFVSKGCVGCHTRNDVDVGVGATIAPVLTGKRYEAEWLRKFLADPTANATNTGTFRMPNLGLKPGEIALLVAFVNAERGRSQ